MENWEDDDFRSIVEKVIGNLRNEVKFTLKPEILSFRSFSLDLDFQKFYKMVEVSIELLEIFLATL